MPNGEEYVGEWSDGQRNGQGTYTWPDGKAYVGEFQDSKPDGQGTETLPDGEKYVGEWSDGKRNGQGTETWPDGKTYVGDSGTENLKKALANRPTQGRSVQAGRGCAVAHRKRLRRRLIRRPSSPSAWPWLTRGRRSMIHRSRS